MDWMSGDIRKFEKVEVRPIEEAEELLASIPENAIITAETRSLKTIRIKYVLTKDLTKERVIELNKQTVEPIKVKVQKYKPGNTLALINIADFHLNRKVWGKQGFDKDYSIELAEKVFTGIIEEAYLRIKNSPHKIEKIILNTGGDFLNSDTITSTTTRGTPQQDDVSWQEGFNVAKKLLSYALLRLSELAPVEHFYVQGNHDVMSGWYLVSWLNARFSQSKNILVDENPKCRQVIKYNKNLIILAHGDTEGSRSIDLPFNEPEARKYISECENIEVLTGHIHTESVTTKNGVRWETLACSCPVGDLWSYDMGFNTSRSVATINYYGEDSRLQQDSINVNQIYQNILEM